MHPLTFTGESVRDSSGERRQPSSRKMAVTRIFLSRRLRRPQTVPWKGEKPIGISPTPFVPLSHLIAMRFLPIAVQAANCWNVQLGILPNNRMTRASAGQGAHMRAARRGSVAVCGFWLLCVTASVRASVPREIGKPS